MRTLQLPARRTASRRCGSFRRAAGAVAACLLLVPLLAPAQVSVDARLLVHPAWVSPSLTATAYQSVARAGKRIVAVGERGTIALSDDDGRSWRQARRVPVPAMLTSVWFVDAQTGWAAGHWGTILKTNDGGESWVLQHADVTVDQPFFSIRFSSPTHGMAVGLWSMAFRTEDGGATWTRVEMPVAPGAKRADRNLYCLFGDADGRLFISAEKGAVLRSQDGGAHWETIETGYSGSLWAGIALGNGDLLVGGLRGSVLRSADHGATWRPETTGVHSSITAFAQLPNGVLQATALDGITLTSRDEGKTFLFQQRPDRAAYTAAVVTAAGNSLLFTTHGPAIAAP